MPLSAGDKLGPYERLCLKTAFCPKTPLLAQKLGIPGTGFLINQVP
jgi:hypothetical protein